jgi:hypothetical protein
MAREPLMIEGDVRRRAVNAASKSARVAVVLVAAEAAYVLRRRGAPSLGDAALEVYVGHRVRAVGVVSAGQLICSAIDIL